MPRFSTTIHLHVPIRVECNANSPLHASLAARLMASKVIQGLGKYTSADGHPALGLIDFEWGRPKELEHYPPEVTRLDPAPEPPPRLRLDDPSTLFNIVFGVLNEYGGQPLTSSTIQQATLGIMEHLCLEPRKNASRTTPA